MPTQEAMVHIAARRAKRGQSVPVVDVTAGPGKAFAERMISYYNSWIGDGEKPSAILTDLMTNSGGLRDDVQANTASLVNGIGQGLGNTDDTAHAAVKRIGTAFNLKVRDPKTPKPEKPAAQPKTAKAPKPQPKPAPAKDKPEEKDAGKQPQKGQGKPEKGESEQEEQAGACGGQGEGEDSEQEGEGQANGGQGSGETEGEESSSGSSREIASQDGGNDDDDSQPIDMEKEKTAFKEMSGYELQEPEKSKLNRWQNYRNSTNFQFGRTNGLMSKLREELASIARVRKFNNRSDGEVDFDKVSDIASKQNLDRIYYTQRNARKVNTAVQILMDVSDSTGGRVNESITGLAHVIASVLEKMRVPCQVIAFEGGSNLVKDWHEKVNSVNIYLADDAGGTNLPQAQVQCATELNKRREKRKVQFVITDGDVGWQPADNSANIQLYTEHCERHGFTGAQRAQVMASMPGADAQLHITRLQKHCPGVESYAFGVGVKVTSGIFEVAVSNLTAENMCDVVAKSMGKALMADNRV